MNREERRGREVAGCLGGDGGRLTGNGDGDAAPESAGAREEGGGVFQGADGCCGAMENSGCSFIGSSDGEPLRRQWRRERRADVRGNTTMADGSYQRVIAELGKEDELAWLCTGRTTGLDGSG